MRASARPRKFHRRVTIENPLETVALSIESFPRLLQFTRSFPGCAKKSQRQELIFIARGKLASVSFVSLFVGATSDKP